MQSKLLSRMAATARSLAGRNWVEWQGSILPTPELRFNGSDQQNNAVYLESAIAEADRVVTRLDYVPEELLVDIGCGQGRLAIGLARRWPTARYLGLDVSRRSIAWCRKQLEARYPAYRFQHVDLVNARYNPEGSALAAGFHLPVADGSAAVAYLWAVFTNMEPEHLDVYAREISRMLQPAGRLFLTANVEPGVPDLSVNPEGYLPFSCVGPLHVVRYEIQYFLGAFGRVGLALTHMDHRCTTSCQSELYFVKAPVAPHHASQ